MPVLWFVQIQAQCLYCGLYKSKHNVCIVVCTHPCTMTVLWFVHNTCIVVCTHPCTMPVLWFVHIHVQCLYCCLYTSMYSTCIVVCTHPCTTPVLWFVHIHITCIVVCTHPRTMPVLWFVHRTHQFLSMMRSLISATRSTFDCVGSVYRHGWMKLSHVSINCHRPKHKTFKNKL